jgi:hypothetical protein
LPRAEWTEERIPGIDSHPELQTAEVLRKPRGAPLHLQTGSDRALGIVVMRYRGAEHGHQLIADNPCDKAAQSVDDVTQRAHAPIYDNLYFFRVATLTVLGEANEVREKDC